MDLHSENQDSNSQDMQNVYEALQRGKNASDSSLLADKVALENDLPLFLQKVNELLVLFNTSVDKFRGNGGEENLVISEKQMDVEALINEIIGKQTSEEFKSALGDHCFRQVSLGKEEPNKSMRISFITRFNLPSSPEPDMDLWKPPADHISISFAIMFSSFAIEIMSELKCFIKADGSILTRDTKMNEQTLSVAGIASYLNSILIDPKIWEAIGI